MQAAIHSFIERLHSRLTQLQTPASIPPPVNNFLNSHNRMRTTTPPSSMDINISSSVGLWRCSKKSLAIIIFQQPFSPSPNSRTFFIPRRRPPPTIVTSVREHMTSIENIASARANDSYPAGPAGGQQRSITQHSVPKKFREGDCTSNLIRCSCELWECRTGISAAPTYKQPRRAMYNIVLRKD